MVYFQTKNPNSGKFWSPLDWKLLIYFVAIWNILRAFGTFYDQLLHFCVDLEHFSGFGTMYKENLATLTCIVGNLCSDSAVIYAFKTRQRRTTFI
jgi:hypothetical protein